jgi:hypothetical protein
MTARGRAAQNRNRSVINPQRSVRNIRAVIVTNPALQYFRNVAAIPCARLPPLTGF